ncbi:hypothetical protein DM02DRAFT_147561, partial [Periconia macrospinosa]
MSLGQALRERRCMAAARSAPRKPASQLLDSMASTGGVVVYTLFRKKTGPARGLHRHRDYAAVGLHVAFQSGVPWRTRFEPCAVHATASQKFDLNHRTPTFFPTLGLPTTTAATTMSLHTFPTQQLQFISYEGPPEPKQSKYAKKTPVNEDMCSDHDGILNTKPRPNAGQGRVDSTCTPSGANVIDLTHSINEPNRQLSDEREVDDDLLSYD